MYLAIDIGGTKTQLAIFDQSGKKISDKKFPTNENYETFLKNLEKNVAEISTNEILYCVCGVPGLLDREKGIAESLGNLPWKNKTISADVSKVINGLPVIIENDARLAGLAESAELVGIHEHVLYLTISTGIGGALTRNGEISVDLLDTEVGSMPLSYEGRTQAWEKFASGKSIVSRYGKQASEIEDTVVWQEIGQRIGYGVAVCCSVMQPDAIVFGGGVGQFADKFTASVTEYLDKNLNSMIRRPKALLQAKYGSESVVQGCYILLKQNGK